MNHFTVAIGGLFISNVSHFHVLAVITLYKWKITYFKVMSLDMIYVSTLSRRKLECLNINYVINIRCVISKLSSGWLYWLFVKWNIISYVWLVLVISYQLLLLVWSLLVLVQGITYSFVLRFMNWKHFGANANLQRVYFVNKQWQ